MDGIAATPPQGPPAPTPAPGLAPRAAAATATPAAAELRAPWEGRADAWTWQLRAWLGDGDPARYRAACDARLVAVAAASRGHTSVRPVAGFLLAGMGKLALGRGLAYLIAGVVARDVVAASVGGALAGAGFAASIAIAFGFSRYVAAVDPGYAALVKAASISATGLLLGGNLLRGLAAARPGLSPAAPLLPLIAGFGTMTFALPTFVAHAKLVDGRVRPLDGVLQGHLFCSAGLGIGFGYAAVSPDPATPGPVGDALIVIGTMLLLYGVGLARTERLLLRAEAAATASAT